MIFKFYYSLVNIQNISKFVNVYNVTQNCQTSTLSNVDVVKIPKGKFYGRSASIPSLPFVPLCYQKKR